MITKTTACTTLCVSLALMLLASAELTPMPISRAAVEIVIIIFL